MNGPRRLLLAGGALTVLLAVVAVASRAHRPGGGTGGGRAHVPLLLGQYVGVMALLLILVTGVLAGWAAADQRRKKALAGRTNWRRTLTGFLAVLLAVAFGLFYTRHLRQNTTPRAQPATGVGAPLRAAARQRAKGQRPTPAQKADVVWLTVLVLGSAALGVAVAVGLALRHRRAHGDELDEEAALALALDEVLADTLDDLREERDPRRAVIRVYARMERTFAAYRVPREPAETPLEYVARVLASLSVSAHAVRRVTLLFERAKFSSHEVDAGMKDQAIAALAGLRAELELQHREEAA